MITILKMTIPYLLQTKGILSNYRLPCYFSIKNSSPNFLKLNSLRFRVLPKKEDIEVTTWAIYSE